MIRLVRAPSGILLTMKLYRPGGICSLAHQAVGKMWWMSTDSTKYSASSARWPARQSARALFHQQDVDSHAGGAVAGAQRQESVLTEPGIADSSRFGTETTHPGCGLGKVVAEPGLGRAAVELVEELKPALRIWLVQALEQGPTAHGGTEERRWTRPGSRCWWRVAGMVAPAGRSSPGSCAQMGFSVSITQVAGD